MRDGWKRRGVIGTTKRGHVAIRISRSRSVTRITLFSLRNNAREVRSWDSVIYGLLYISIRLGQLRAQIFVTGARPTVIVIDDNEADDCFIRHKIVDKIEWTYALT